MRHELVAEVDAALAIGQLPNPVTYKEAIKALPYFKAYINEAMRLHPGVRFHLPRVVPQGATRISGVYIPTGGYNIGVNAADLLRKFEMRLMEEEEWKTRNLWFNRPVDVKVVIEEREWPREDQ
ncbi:hypothetical protein BJX70DRAFT_394640 [Aspergillus crustosus]